MKRALVIAMVLGSSVGCHKNRDAEGPMQRAGASVDDAAEKTGAALHKAAVKTDEVAHEAVTATGNALEKAGEKLKGTPRATEPTKAPAPSSNK